MPGWLSLLDLWLLISAQVIIQGLWDWAPCQDLHWAWSLLKILSLPLSFTHLGVCCLRKKKNRVMFWNCYVWHASQTPRRCLHRTQGENMYVLPTLWVNGSQSQSGWESKPEWVLPEKEGPVGGKGWVEDPGEMTVRFNDMGLTLMKVVFVLLWR